MSKCKGVCKTGKKCSKDAIEGGEYCSVHAKQRTVKPKTVLAKKTTAKPRNVLIVKFEVDGENKLNIYYEAKPSKLKTINYQK
jgi:hypothetical protein